MESISICLLCARPQGFRGTQLTRARLSWLTACLMQRSKVTVTTTCWGLKETTLAAEAVVRRVWGDQRHDPGHGRKLGWLLCRTGCRGR